MENLIKVAIIEGDPKIRQLMQLIIDGSLGFACHQVFEDCESEIPELEKYSSPTFIRY